MIDWARVNELRDEVGAEDFAEVATLFLEETDAAIAVLPTLPDAGLGAHLHGLKGSALNLGFAALAAKCQAGEVAARGGAGIDRAAIVACYAASKAAFLAAPARPAPG